MLTFFEQLRVDLDKHLEGVVHHAVDGPAVSSQAARISRRRAKNPSHVDPPIPVRSRIGKQGREDEREDDLDVFAHQGDDVRIVPVIQRSFGDL